MPVFQADVVQAAAKPGQARRDTIHPPQESSGAVRHKARLVRALLTCCLGLACARPSLAASGELADTVATVLAVIIIIVLPIAGVVLFWLVHVLPEKIAEKRHHPQKDAIHMLCLLSLVFGGLLWPLAWLWAYTKPVLHQLAYGRDRHDDYYDESAGTEGNDRPAPDVQDELARLRRDLEALEMRGASPEASRAIDTGIQQIEENHAPGSKKGGVG